MRLIDVSVDSLVVRQSSQIPPYAILSHRWVGQEVVYPDFELVPQSQLQTPISTNPVPRTPTGAVENVGPDTVASVYKIAGAYKTVRAMNPEIHHLWIDTLCINKGESRELTAAINSMFEWYKNSAVCYVYLFDVTWSAAEDPVGSREQFRTSHWFERGWTLQELLAPRQVWFFDRDWRYIGTKQELAEDITQATGISHEHLLHDFRIASTAQKMSWLARRTTTLPEDISYCAQGLFGVFFDLRYGVGCEEEFLRLQWEIFTAGADVGRQLDESLFAWTDDKINSSGLLAREPKCFLYAGDVVFEPGLFKSRKSQIQGQGKWLGINMSKLGTVEIHIPTRFRRNSHQAALVVSICVTLGIAMYGFAAYIACKSIHRCGKDKHLINLNCWKKDPDGRFRTVQITATQTQKTWRRVDCGKLVEGNNGDLYSQSDVHGRQGRAIFLNERD